MFSYLKMSKTKNLNKTGLKNDDHDQINAAGRHFSDHLTYRAISSEPCDQGTRSVQ